MFRSQGQALPPPSQAPSYELKWPNAFSGETDVVFDWLNLPLAQFGNIAAFINQTSPNIQLVATNSPVVSPTMIGAPTEIYHDDGDSHGPRSSTGPALDDRSYTTPNTLMMLSPDTAFTYQLQELWAAFRVPYGVGIRLDFPVLLTHLKPPEVEVVYTPQLSGFHFIVRPESPNQPPDGATEFTWFATDKPDARRPFYDQMMHLTTEHSEFTYLDTALHSDFAVSSWFAVLWVPVHIKNHSQTHSAGTFLSFYFINPPLNMGGSMFHGDEPCFRTVRLGVQKPVWLLDPNVLATDEVNAIAPSDAPSRSGTPATQQAASAANASSSSAFPGAPVVPSSTSSHRDSPSPQNGAPGGRRVSLRVPMFAFIPSRFRCDVWFRNVPEQSRRCNFVAPLFMIVAAFQLLAHEAATNPKWTEDYRLVDAHFLTRHERTMLEFMSIYTN
jgi:hypothetical protein